MTSNIRKSIRPSAWLVTVLGLVLSLVVVGACSHKPTLTPEQQASANVAAYEERIRKIVPDPACADNLVALTNEFQQLVQESIPKAKQYRAQIATLNSNYDATRAQYEALFNEQDAARQAFQKQAGALRDRMAALTTDAEWDQLRKARLAALDADIQAFGTDHGTF